MGKYVMALDAGTTSNRCILFNKEGKVVSIAQKEFTQYFPKPGWVEHDADEIWSTQLGVAVEAMSKIGARLKILQQLVLRIKEKQLLCGTRKRASLYAPLLCGSVEGQRNSVIN